MASVLQESLPPPLDSKSEQPPLFDGTTRLYICYKCPFAQRVWITRNYKGVQEQIKLVGLNLQDRPAWYKEKVYPPNKDPGKREFGEELLSYSDTFNRTVFTSFKGDPEKEASHVFDNLENALCKFDNGPFFLGQFSMVDVIYIPFVERFQIILPEIFKYDIMAGRTKLAAWVEEMDKIDVYKATKPDPEVVIEGFKKLFMGQ